jgi:hypothetical protein
MAKKRWIQLLPAVAFVLIGLATPLAAQDDGDRRIRFSGLELHLGGSVYETDHGNTSGGGAGGFFQGDGLCLESGAFITAYGGSADLGGMEVDGTWNHTRWPWHTTGGRGGGAAGGGAAQDFAERHGNALELAAQFRVVQLIRPGTWRGDHVSGDLLVGVGGQISFDAGGDDTYQGLPVYKQQGGFAPLATFGGYVDLHPNGSRVALRARGTVRRLFLDEVKYELPGGQIEPFNVDDAVYGMVSLGVVLRF